MKKNLNPKKLLSCALLMLGGISSLHAATLTVKVRDSYGKKLSGVSVQWVQSGYTTLGTGTTDTTGEVTGTIPNNINYKVRVTYGGTSYQMLSAKYSGTGSNMDTFYTSELKVVTKSGGQPIAGMGVQYMTGYPTGSWIQAGSTDVAGEKSIQVFPFDNMNVKINANGSYETHTIATFPYGAKQAVECFSNLVLLQSPNTYFLVGGSWQSGNAGKYVFPGTYQTRVNNTYLSNVTLTGSSFDKVPVVILVKAHSNVAIPGASIRGGYGTIPNGGGFGWHCAPTDVNGITVEWVNAGSKICSYEAKVNGTTSAQSKDVTLTNGNLFTFKASELTLKLKDCAGNAIAGGSARYGIGTNYSSWYFPGANKTDSSGTLSMEAFPGTYSFEMGINQSTQVKQIVFDGTNGLCWNTTKVSINWPYAVAFGGNGGNTWFPNKAGTEMLPGTWNFRFDAPGGSTIAPITVSGCSTSKSPIIVRLLRANGTPIENGQPYYHANGWQVMPPTNAAGNSVALVDANPGVMYSRMSYMGGLEERIQDMNANPIVTYKTTPVTMDFKNSNGVNSNTMEGYNLKFFSDSWRTFGTGEPVASADAPTTAATSGGVATMELLPVTYYFRLSYMGGTQEIIQNVAANKTVCYKTTPVTIDFKNSNGDNSVSMEGSNLKFFSNSWRTFGTGEPIASADVPTTAATTGGLATMELLPLTYYFRLSYMGGTQEIIQNVAAEKTVSYKTTPVTIDFKNSNGENSINMEGSNLKFFSNSWRTFGTGEPVASADAPTTATTIGGLATMELLPLTYYFRLSYMGGTQEIIQNVAAEKTVSYKTTLVTMELRKGIPYGPMITSRATDLKFYSNEWKTFGTVGNASMELLPLTYYFGLSYNGAAFETVQNVAANQLVSFVATSTMRKTANTMATTEVSFYPNPVINNLHVSMPAAGTVEILSIEGKKLAQYEVAEGTTTIDVSSIPVGNYVMIINYNGQTETHKFIKN